MSQKSKIVVIHEGVDVDRFSRRYSDADHRQIRKKHELPSNYILSVGHLEPRKNYARLLQAFHILKIKYKAPHKLVIVGQKNWHFKEVEHAINRYRLRQHVRVLDFIDANELPFLYQNAALLVAPSYFEGFGFTPLESMAAGVPVAAALATSYPEVCGDAASYFDPFDIEAMAETIFRLLNDEELCQKRVKQGYENIKKWSWSACISKTITLYEECLKSI